MESPHPPPPFISIVVNIFSKSIEKNVFWSRDDLSRITVQDMVPLYEIFGSAPAHVVLWYQ